MTSDRKYLDYSRPFVVRMKILAELEIYFSNKHDSMKLINRKIMQ